MRLARLAALVVSMALTSGCAPSGAGISGDAGSAACGSCHTTEYAEWSTSRLASSGDSPVFKALSGQAGTAWGGEAETRCKSCHAPGFGGDPSIGCVACHSATGNLAVRDGLLTVDLGAPVDGPFADALPTPAHGSTTSGFLESPELCGTCHQVTGPGLFHETTLDEYDDYAPDAATQAAAGGCAGCHMPPEEPGPIAVGQTNSRVRTSHAFVGVDPPWGASADIAASAAAATLALLRSGLALSATRAGAGFDVTLTNNAGHAVPTGITFLRCVWVDVELIDGRGATMTLPSVVSLGAQPTKGGAPVALVTAADAVLQHSVAPGGTLTVHVDVPPSLPAPVLARMTLRAAAVRPEILDALGLDAVAAEVPTHEVAIVVIR